MLPPQTSDLSSLLLSGHASVCQGSVIISISFQIRFHSDFDNTKQVSGHLKKIVSLNGLSFMFVLDFLTFENGIIRLKITIFDEYLTQVNRIAIFCFFLS